MIEKLNNFKNNQEQLEIFNRPSPNKSNFFFKELTKSIFSTTGFVSKDQSKKDIEKLLIDILPQSIQIHPFYNFWLNDMSCICDLFCTFLNPNELN